MKKIILSVSAVVLIGMTSCEKKDATKTDTTPTENTASTDNKTPSESPSTNAPKTVMGVEVPKFSNPEAQKFADDYATFMAEATEISKSGDAAKMQEFSKKTQEWATKQAEMALKMTPEDAKLWSEFAMKLSQAQMPK